MGKHKNIYYKVGTCTEIHEKTRENTRKIEAKPRTGYEELNGSKVSSAALRDQGGGLKSKDYSRLLKIEVYVYLYVFLHIRTHFGRGTPHAQRSGEVGGFPAPNTRSNR